MAIDKAVALSPSTWDDLLWTSIKKALYKALGKNDESVKQLHKKTSKKERPKTCYAGDYIYDRQSDTIKKR